MRRVLIASALLACGCDCGKSHAPTDAGPSARDAAVLMDGGMDAGAMADAGRRLDAGPRPDVGMLTDAGPAECRVECGAPAVLARRASSSSLEVESIVGVAVHGADLGILVRQYEYRGGDNYPAYSLVHVDLARGEVGPIVAPATVYTYSGLVAGGLSASADGFAATVWRTETLTRFRAEARVAAATWTLAGALGSEHAELSRLTDTLGPCGCNHRGTSFARAGGSVAAMVSDDTLWLVPVTHGTPFSAGAPLPWVRWPSAPPRTTPLAGDAFSDGRVVVAGGGYAPSIEPRDAFLVLGAIGETPAMAAVPGERFDPPPLVAVQSDRLFVFRFASEAADLARSRIVADERARADGADVARVELQTAHGLVPTAMATYRGAGGAGLAWTEASGEVRVLPAAGEPGESVEWTQCTSVRTPPVAAFPTGVSPAPLHNGGAALFAVGAGDGLDPTVGDLVVVFLEPDHAISVIAIPECSVIREEP